MRTLLALLLAVAPAAFSWQSAPTPDTPEAEAKPAAAFRASYVLGPDDQISVRALDAEEITDKPVRIDMSGSVRLPMVGRIKAAGLTVEQLEAEIAARLKDLILVPEVSVSVTEFRSQPVSILGSVKSPGVHQLQGRKTLVEILSLAGGLAENAGHAVKIARKLEYGPIPLPSAKNDTSGGFSVAEVSIKGIMDASSPRDNIEIKPYDVVSVPKAEMVYVTGQVVRSGGYVLNERETLSALKALTLAGGLDRLAKPQESKIIRPGPKAQGTVEIAVDLRAILAGKAPDLPLQPEDILFVPSNAPKRALGKIAEAAIQIGTGLAIYRR